MGKRGPRPRLRKPQSLEERQRALNRLRHRCLHHQTGHGEMFVCFNMGVPRWSDDIYDAWQRALDEEKVKGEQTQ